MKMSAGEAYEFRKDLRGATSMLSNWLHSSTTEQKQMLHDAFGGRDKIIWHVLENNLKNIVRGAELTTYRLDEAMDKTEVNI